VGIWWGKISSSTKLKYFRFVQVCEKLGAGEILLNCIDRDGTNSGFDIELVKDIRENITIPVIASSGAGKG
jgi:glutamine amidotransferase/cyclase